MVAVECTSIGHLGFGPEVSGKGSRVLSIGTYLRDSDSSQQLKKYEKEDISILRNIKSGHSRHW